MDRKDVLKVVTHTGDCYRIKTRHKPEPFNMYVTKINDDKGWPTLEQDSSQLPYKIVSFQSIESVEAY